MNKNKKTKHWAVVAAFAATLATAAPASAAPYGPIMPEPREKPKQALEVPKPVNGAIENVPVSTLETIAACESGGDPTAVNPAGYYGKYQFDEATWASVGGSGNPAEASEAEQDYRAALLYSRAGASPWPVCGA